MARSLHGHTRTRRVGEVDYEVQHTDREGAKQIYHLNLLKAWKEVVAVSLVTVDQERDELGPEVTHSKIKGTRETHCSLSLFIYAGWQANCHILVMGVVKK